MLVRGHELPRIPQLATSALATSASPHNSSLRPPTRASSPAIGWHARRLLTSLWHDEYHALGSDFRR